MLASEAPSRLQCCWLPEYHVARGRQVPAVAHAS